jgi:hypothetical protein
LQSQDHCAGLRGLPLKTMECGRSGHRAGGAPRGLL